MYNSTVLFLLGIVGPAQTGGTSQPWSASGTSSQPAEMQAPSHVVDGIEADLFDWDVEPFTPFPEFPSQAGVLTAWSGTVEQIGELTRSVLFQLALPYLEKKREHLKAAIAQQQERLESLDSRTRELETVQRDIERLRQQSETLQAELNRRLTERESEIEEADGRLEEIRASVLAAEAGLARLHGETRNKEQELQTSLARSRDEETQINERLAQLQAAVMTEKQHLAASKQQAKDARAQLDMIRDEAEAQRKAVETARETVQELAVRSSQLRASCDELARQETTLQARLQDARSNQFPPSGTHSAPGLGLSTPPAGSAIELAEGQSVTLTTGDMLALTDDDSGDGCEIRLNGLKLKVPSSHFVGAQRSDGSLLVIRCLAHDLPGDRARLSIYHQWAVRR